MDMQSMTRRTREDNEQYPFEQPPEIYEVPEYPVKGRGAGGGSSSGSQIYNAPYYDSSKITALTQKRAMPGIRSLREQVQQITGRRYDNPNVAKMSLREALKGYGSGLDKVISGAGEAAVDEYGQEYGALADASKTSFMASEDRRTQSNREALAKSQTIFNANLTRNKDRYQSLYDKWKSGSKSKSVTTDEQWA